MTALDNLFTKVRAENRAALIAYIPAGFPSQAGCQRVIAAFIAGGVDAIEIGFVDATRGSVDQHIGYEITVPRLRHLHFDRYSDPFQIENR